MQGWIQDFFFGGGGALEKIGKILKKIGGKNGQNLELSKTYELNETYELCELIK